MPENIPVVSVLMTAHNREKFISEAIESVLLSAFRDFELIIVDDRSTDKTVSIARSFMERDQRIKLHLNEKNLGDYQNRNKAASFAKGEFIMYCDSDDRFFPDSIGYCVQAMQSFPNAGIGLYYAAEKPAPFIMDTATVIHKHFFEHPVLTIGPGGSIIRRQFFLSIGGYPEKYGPANDMYFNLKACSKTDVLFLPKLFLYYRIHEGQEKNNAYSYMYNNYRYLEDAMKEINLGLTDKEMNYLKKKNNRRFAVNLLRYFIKTKDLPATKRLWQMAGFDVRSFFTGIFHFS